MKKLGIFAAAVAGLALAFSVLAPLGVAQAEEPPEPLPPVAFEHELHLRPWLRETIILSAAQTIGIPVEDVRLGLRNGASLSEIGVRHGVRPEVLARGIIRHEHDHIGDLVRNGRISPAEGRWAMAFVTGHIRLIINHKWTPNDVV